MKQVIEYLSNNWEWIGPIVYELAVRLIPSAKSLSIINAVKKTADVVVPNLRKEGGTHD